MARKDKDEKREQRARAEVEGKIARQRFDEAVDAWLSLPPDARTAFRAPLSLGARAAIERAHRNRDVPAQLAWLKRIEHVPELLSSDEEALSTRWQLLVAALRARQWQRARAHLELLEPWAEASTLLSTIRRVIETEGSPPKGTLPDTSAEDARLGYEPVRATQVYAAPTTLENAETHCLVCFGAEPWHRFHDIVRGWIPSLPEPVAKEVQRVAAQLGGRELVERMAHESGDALVVARFIAACTVGAGAPPELEALVALSIRAVALRTAEIIEDRALVDACYELTAAALRYPSLVPLLETLVVEALYDFKVARSAERLLQRVIEHRRTIAPVLKVAHIIALGPDSGGPARMAPDWLVRAFEGLLNEPAPFAAHLEQIVRGPSRPRIARGVDKIFGVLPVPLAVRMIDAVWSHSSEELREALAEQARELVTRMRLGHSSGAPLDPKTFRKYLLSAGCRSLSSLPTRICEHS